MSSATASSRRTRSIRENLVKSAEADKFLSVRWKDGKPVLSRVYITGRKTMWEKNPDFAYSFTTRLAGVPSEVERYLKEVGMNDETAGPILDAYLEDRRRHSLVTLLNHEDDSSFGVISGFDGRRVHGTSVVDLVANEEKTRKTSREASRDEAKRAKDDMIHPYEIPELLKAYREAQGELPTTRRSSGKHLYAQKVGALLKEVDENPSRYYNISGFTTEGGKQRKVDADKIPDNAKHVAPSGELHHFLVQPDKGRQGLLNFLTLYHVYKGLSVGDAAAEAKKTVAEVAPGRGRAVSPRRSGSRAGSRSRSGSRSSSAGSRSKSSSRKAKSPAKPRAKAAAKKGAAVKAKSPKAKSPKTKSPRSTRAKSPKATSPRTKSPKAKTPRSPRSTSSTSPDQKRSASTSPGRRSPRATGSPSGSPARRSTAPRTTRLARPPKK